MSETVKNSVKKSVDPGDELVEVELFKDGGKYKNDVFVSVNNEHIQIKRGERVKIKRKFAEVLENSERQRKFAAKTMDEFSKNPMVGSM